MISPNNMISFVVRLLECILQKCGFTFRSEYNTLTSKKKKKDNKKNATWMSLNFSRQHLICWRVSSFIYLFKELVIFFTSLCASVSYKENTSTQWNFTQWCCYPGCFEANFGGVRRYFLKDHYKEITDFLDPGSIQISEKMCHVES